MEFGVLGPLRVVDGGETLPIGGPIRRAVLAYLLLHANRAVPSDELIDAIWDGRPPESAASSLQNHVARLRRVLGADRLLTRERGYELRVEAGELDLDVVESLVDEGEHLDAGARSAQLREALRLWRGRPLAELDSFTFARVEELRLEERRLDVLEDCLDAELAAGRGDGVVSELRALVSKHPLRERLRGQLMVALYAHGRQAEGLEVYRVGRETLVKEAGLEPGPALRDLERAILRQELPLRPSAHVANGRVRTQKRGGARMRMALAALLIASVAVAVGLAARREPQPALAAIGANSLGVIDPDRNELVAAIAVGQRPVSVAVGPQAVWVANAGDETVSRIDLTARELVENVRARADWGSVVVGRRAIWVVGRVGRSPNYQAAISRIDPDVAAVTDAARYGAISVRYDESFAIDEGLGAVWVTAGWRLLRLDQNGRLQKRPMRFRALEASQSARVRSGWVTSPTP